MSTTLCESLLDLLAEAGARRIWGMTGDVLNPLLEAIRVDDRFDWLGVRHEEHAAYAAAAEAELTGRIGVCAGTAGPGALHLINGLYNAKKEGAGVVAIAGQLARAERGADFHKEMDLTRIFEDVCDYQAIIETPEQVPRMAEIAIQKALVERVVTRIELPADVIAASLPDTHFRHPLVQQVPRPVAPAEQLERAAQVLNAGGKVSLFAGIGCRGAESLVVDLAERLQAPIAHTLRAKQLFDGLSPRVVGLTGLLGNPAGYHAVHDCDVLFMIGTDFPYDEFLPKGIPIVQLDRAVDHIGRRAPVTVGLVGDVGATLEALNPLCRGDASRFSTAVSSVHERWQRHMDAQVTRGAEAVPMHPQAVARAVSDRASEDAIFAFDVGECTIWLARQMSLAGGREAVSGFNHGSLGSGLPLALGAAASHPGREVWAVCGDGGFGMSMNDFVTAVRFGWPVKVVVLDNSELSFVKMEMEVAGLPTNEAATGLMNPDFARFAEACGAEGVRVERADELGPAIDRALASPGPFLIDAVVSAGELSMPPHVGVATAWGFGVSKVKEGWLGLKGDHDVWRQWREELRSLLL